MSKTVSSILSFLRRRWCLLTALLLFLSFPSYDTPLLKGFPFFAWFCLVPLFIAARGMTFKKLYIASFVTFIIGSLFTWGWMGSFGGDTLEGHLVIWSLLLPCIAFLLSGRIIVAEFLSRRYPKFRVFIYPGVWLLGDLLQSLGYLAFPWNYLGYSQYPVLPFVQVSSLIGILGVTFLIAAGNSIVAEFLFINRERILSKDFRPQAFVQKKRLSFYLLFVLLIIAAGEIRIFKGLPDGSRSYRISMVQSCISPWADWDRLKYAKLSEITRLSDTVMPASPDLLVWSESATLEPVSFRARIGHPDQFDQIIMDYAKTNRTPILTGEIGVLERQGGFGARAQNSAVLIDRSGSIAENYAKIHLCPFGEWFPYADAMPWMQELALKMGGSDFVPGTDPVMFYTPGASFGVLICYEGMFFRLSSTYRNSGADFLVNITNDSWSGSYGGHFQHFAAAPFRAAENGIWFVRVGNDGYTAVLDPLGRTVKSIPIMEKGVMTADIQPDRKISTLYSRVGDLFSYCILGILVLLCALCEYKILKSRTTRRS